MIGDSIDASEYRRSKAVAQNIGASGDQPSVIAISTF